VISRTVLQGSVGVSRSAQGPWVLLQTSDETDQTRVTLTKKQTEDLIQELRRQLRLIPDTTESDWLKEGL
jgi:hypothetical protein